VGAGETLAEIIQAVRGAYNLSSVAETLNISLDIQQSAVVRVEPKTSETTISKGTFCIPFVEYRGKAPDDRKNPADFALMKENLRQMSVRIPVPFCDPDGTLQAKIHRDKQRLIHLYGGKEELWYYWGSQVNRLWSNVIQIAAAGQYPTPKGYYIGYYGVAYPGVLPHFTGEYHIVRFEVNTSTQENERVFARTIPKEKEEDCKAFHAYIRGIALQKIPHYWGKGKENSKGCGLRWADPLNPSGNNVRIDQGDAHSAFSSQRVDHVIVNSGGQTLGTNSTVIKPTLAQPKPTKTEFAHIPLSLWKNWESWNVR